MTSFIYRDPFAAHETAPELTADEQTEVDRFEDAPDVEGGAAAFDRKVDEDEAALRRLAGAE
jgi:hypothetical protein